MPYSSNDIPVFLEAFNKMIAKAMNTDRQFVEKFWDKILANRMYRRYHKQ